MARVRYAHHEPWLSRMQLRAGTNGNVQSSARGQCGQRVLNQIDQDLSHLSRMSGDDWILSDKFCGDGDSCGIDMSALQAENVFRNLFQVYLFRLGRLAIVGQGVIRDAGHTFQLLLGQRHGRLQLGRQIRVRSDQVHQVHDGFEWVIDFVTDAGGKSADGGQSFGCNQRFSAGVHFSQVLIDLF